MKSLRHDHLVGEKLIMTRSQTHTLTPDQIEEDRHWWFASRTRALLGMLDRCVPDDDLRILDVGCGAGNMIHHLSRYGEVKGIEMDPRPLAVARQRGYDAQLADAAKEIPFEEGTFDLVAVLDVIEHNEDDLGILRECHRVLKPGRLVVITVPAFQWLWSYNDVINAHLRRYTAGGLAAKLKQVGFGVRRMTYNNFFVFPMAIGLILSRRGTGREPQLASHHLQQDEYQVEMEPVPPLVNAVLSGVGWMEANLLKWVDLPVGTSIICIGEKRAMGLL
ncbi:MAG: class I SAM-dependent methyltransferase [Anaerolineae bacterium]